MKHILFFTFNELVASNGISKKIEYQRNALEANGNCVHLMHIKPEGTRILLYIDEKKIASLPHNLLWTFKLFPLKKVILAYVEENNIDSVYVRYTQFASLGVNNLFRALKNKGLHIALEIPSYPYDSEFKTFRQKILITWEKVWRKQLAKQLDFIVTFSQFDSIWKRPTLRIKNGIDFSKIPLRSENKPIQSRVEIIAVAGLAFWHGFDRVIEGLRLYYLHNCNAVEVHLNIVGKGYQSVYDSLVDLVTKYELEKYVTFWGELYGKSLDDLFENADVAIGCLGCHRKNIKEISSLKNVEYAARGIPFIYSEINKDFDDKLYVKKESPDDTPIDISELIQWRRCLRLHPKTIRDSVIDVLSWNSQMKMVSDYFCKM